MIEAHGTRWSVGAARECLAAEAANHAVGHNWRTAEAYRILSSASDEIVEAYIDLKGWRDDISEAEYQKLILKLSRVGASKPKLKRFKARYADLTEPLRSWRIHLDNRGLIP
jgi:hypothetical protein